MNINKGIRAVLLVGAVVVSLSCGKAVSSTSSLMSVEGTLKRIQKADDIPPDFQITYDDMHGLWGGTTIVISGKGSGERRERATGNVQPEVVNKTITREQLLELVKLLIEHEAWEQKTPNREPVPDESRGTLSISIAGHSSRVWEWFNDMKKNQRLLKIKEKMTQMTS